MATLDVIEAIRSRRAVRAYAEVQPSDEQIRLLLDAAVRAPTGLHREPWIFAIVQSRTLLRTISDRMKQRWASTAHVDPQMVAGLPEAAGFIEALARPEFNAFYDAGTLVVIGARRTTPWVDADCWLAAENLMLAAHAMGLGSCVIGSAIDELNASVTKREVGLPHDVAAIAPIIVGLPRVIPPPTSRRSPDIACWRR